MSRPTFDLVSLDDLTIVDERSFRDVGLYADLKKILQAAGYRFRVLPKAYEGRSDRSLLLNLAFWGAEPRQDGVTPGGDVLPTAEIDADVVTHVAWHLVAGAKLAEPGTPRLSVAALFLGESIASAFDLFLVGRLLGVAPSALFLETQVPAMADAAAAAGLPEDDFEQLLASVASDPDRAFADLRELLFEATSALHACADADSALAALASFDSHRFAPLLHHYELSTWVLYARAFGGAPTDPRTDAVLRDLAAADNPLDWLVSHWLGG